MPDHVKNATGCARYHMLPVIELANVFTQVSTTDAGMALDVHEVAKSQDNLLNLNC
jgi:hypothetical protein